MLTYHEIKGAFDLNVDLDVLVSGLGVIVSAGTFKHGIDYEITEDVEVSFSPETEPCVIYGYLVQVKATDEITVLYDKQMPGDSPYVFDSSSPYRLIETLITAQLPSSATDFESDDVVFKVFRIRP